MTTVGNIIGFIALGILAVLAAWCVVGSFLGWFD